MTNQVIDINVYNKAVPAKNKQEDRAHIAWMNVIFVDWTQSDVYN